MTVQAYLYSGDWIAECSREGCYNAEHLFGLRYPGRPPSLANRRERRLTHFACSNCLQVDAVDWPPNDFMEAVEAVMSARPVPQTRNWYPKDHPTAVTFRVPHGQSLDDLRAENAEHGVPV